MKIKQQSNGGAGRAVGDGTRAIADGSTAHSWSIDCWPADVFPGDPGKAKWLVRERRRELVEANCLARIGRQIIVFGGPYRKWLESRAGRERVIGFEIAPNRDRRSGAAA